MPVLVIGLLAALSVVLIAYIRLRGRYRLALDEAARLTREAAARRDEVEQLQLRDLAKDEFLSTVSHEVRIPLTSIRGALGLLSSGVLGKVDDRASNLLRIASSNTERLVRLINDILDLQRVGSHAEPLPLSPCVVKELLAYAVETMTGMAESAGVQLVIEMDPEVDTLVIEANSDRLLQVLSNLLSNAIKFSPRHSVVVLQAGVDEANVILRVQDSGRGVPAEKLESIFDRFGQVELADARQKGGTGLGLAICRSIVTQHGGTIHAQRNDAHSPGRAGATLVIRLPLPLRNPEAPAALHHLLA